MYSIVYSITIPACQTAISSFSAELKTIKKFSPLAPILENIKVPQLRQPFKFLTSCG